MELEVHDLLKINDLETFDRELPKWAKKSISNMPYVVVRRGVIDRLVPVGIRGNRRNERFGCNIKKESIVEIIKPEHIVKNVLSNSRGNFYWVAKIKNINKILEKYKLVWGPTGSVGFELATNFKVTNENSDIDFIIKPKSKILIESARDILNDIKDVYPLMDPILYTKLGFISLREYSYGNPPFLVKTMKEPKLCADIWEKM